MEYITQDKVTISVHDVDGTTYIAFAPKEKYDGNFGMLTYWCGIVCGAMKAKGITMQAQCRYNFATIIVDGIEARKINEIVFRLLNDIEIVSI